MSAISDVRIVVSAALKDSLRTVTSPVRMLKVIFGAEHEPTVTEKINKEAQLSSQKSSRTKVAL
jgi:hypothetical protein